MSNEKYFSSPDDIFLANGVKKVDFKRNISAGYPLYVDKNNFFVDSGIDNNLGVIGSPGSGKSRRVVYQMLCSLICNGNSFFVNDPKGQLLAWTYELLKREGYKVVEYSFRKEEGDHMGFLYNAALLYQKGKIDDALEIFMEIADALYQEIHDEKDGFWSVSAKNCFTGVCIIASKHFKPEEVTLKNIYELFIQLTKKCGGSSYLKMYIDSYDKDPLLERTFSQYLDAPNETRQSIYSVTTSVLSKYSISEEINSLLAGKSLRAEDIDNKKIAIFVNTRDESTVYNPIISLYIHELYCSLIKQADKNNGCLKRTFFFVCDEFSNMARLKDVVNKLSASRDRGIKWCLILQSMVQLQTVYSVEESECIIGLLNSLIYLFSPDAKMNTYISTRIGTKINENTGKEEPIIPASELQYLNGPLLLFRNKRPFISNVIDKDEFNESYDLPSSSNYKMKRRSRINSADATEIIKMLDKKRNKDIDEYIMGKKSFGSLAVNYSQVSRHDY